MVGYVTRMPRLDFVLDHVHQRYEELGFLSGQLNSTQLGLSTLGKEAIAAMATINRPHWLVATKEGFNLYTDRNNLAFIIDSLSIGSNLAQTALQKVLCCAVRFSFYNYTCIHIKVVDSVLADLPGRWSTPCTVRSLIRFQELPSVSKKGFEWSSRHETSAAQQQNMASHHPGYWNEIDSW